MKLQQVKLESDSSLDSDIFAADIFIKNIIKKHDMSYPQLVNIISNQPTGEVLVPVSILRDKSVGILGAIIRYLKEVLDLKYHEIGVLLNRDDRVIWMNYHNVIKKKRLFSVREHDTWIPVSIFCERALGPLEAISIYLKDTESYRFNEIGKLMNRDNRNIWACYTKGKKKLGGGKPR